MVNGINSYSNMDIWRQQAQQRAAYWAQVGAQGQQAQDSVPPVVVNGINSYSNMDIWRQQAQQRAAQWAQVGAQGQQTQQVSVQPDSVHFGQAPVQQGYVQQSAPVQQTVQEDDGTYKCTDGKDDGTIGKWNAVKEMGKGAGKFLAGLVGFEWGADGKFKGWNGGKALQNLVIGAAIGTVCVLTAGTAVPALIAGAGVVMAGSGLVKQGYRIATAKTDADMKAACNDFGSDAVALGLSVVGAKAAMKQYNPSGNYSGIKGTFKAAWDSTIEGAKLGWNGIKSAYNAYKAGGWTSVKAVATESWNGFTNTVNTNWTNVVKKLTIAETQESRVAKIDKQIEQLKAKAGEEGPKGRVKSQITRLEQQKIDIQNAYKEINDIKSFEGAQTKINEVEANIAKLERKLELTDNKITQTKLNQQISAAKRQLDIYKDVTNAKTSQARNIRAEIERYQKELNGENVTPERVVELNGKIDALKTKQTELDFKLPDKAQHKTYAENATKSSKELVEKQEAYNKAKAEYSEAKKANKFKADDSSDEAMAALAKELQSKDRLSWAKVELDNAKLTNNTNQAFSSASSGYDYAGTLTTARAAAKNILTSFNEQYGTMHTPFKGNKVPFTDWTIPGVDYKFGNFSLGRGWTIAATGNISPIPSLDISINSKDEVTFTELLAAEATGMSHLQVHNALKAQDEYAQAPQASTAEVIGVDPAQYYQAKKAGMAAAQQTGKKTLTPADWQMFDYQMKAYGIA